MRKLSLFFFIGTSTIHERKRRFFKIQNLLQLLLVVFGLTSVHAFCVFNVAIKCIWKKVKLVKFNNKLKMLFLCVFHAGKKVRKFWGF